MGLDLQVDGGTIVAFGVAIPPITVALASFLLASLVLRLWAVAAKPLPIAAVAKRRTVETTATTGGRQRPHAALGSSGGRSDRTRLSGDGGGGGDGSWIGTSNPGFTSDELLATDAEGNGAANGAASPRASPMKRVRKSFSKMTGKSGFFSGKSVEEVKPAHAHPHPHYYYHYHHYH